MSEMDITFSYTKNVLDNVIKHYEELISELKSGKVEFVSFDFTVESNDISLDGLTVTSYATGVITDKIRYRVLEEVPKPVKA